MIQIPSLIEANIAGYLGTFEAISYPIIRAFSLDENTSPCVIVKAGRSTQLEVSTGVFSGTLEIYIRTQIDDVSNALATHDEIVGQTYDAMQAEALVEAFNLNGKLWFINLEAIEQGASESSLETRLEYAITCQNLTLEP